MRVRSWRTAVAALFSLALGAGLLPQLLVTAAPASAATSDPGGRWLQIIKEVGNSGGLNDGITLTARLYEDGDPLGVTGAHASPSSSPITIDWELEGSGPANADGDTPETPDNTCTIPGGGTQCQALFVSATPGSYLVRAWIDLDGKDERPPGLNCDALPTPTECGGTEADRTEGRIASTSEPPAADADCLNSSRNDNLDIDSEDSDQTNCTGTAAPGSKAEPDTTDVVQVGWGAGGTVMDCASARDGSELDIRKAGNPGDPGKIICQVVDNVGAPKSGVRVDAEVLSGPNDPDDKGLTTDNTRADYNTGTKSDANPPVSQAKPVEAFCTTDVSGRCTATIPQSESESGTANICLWVDDDNDTANEQGDNVFAIGGNENDGGRCNETVPDTDTTGTGNGSPFVNNLNKTDVVQVRWENPDATRGGLDLKPETQRVTPGDPATVTVTTYDQFGDIVGGVKVGLEFFTNSASDGDQNSPASEDMICQTASQGSTTPPVGTCQFKFSSFELGDDLFCAFIQPNPPPSGQPPYPTMAGTRDDGTCNGESLTDGTGEDTAPQPTNDRVDVGRVTWAYPAPGGGSGGNGSTPPSTQGYWFVASDGGVFAYGKADFLGSMGGTPLNKPIVGLSATTTHKGYWMVASDGGVFSFGDSNFYGSTGSIPLNQPVVGMVGTHTNKGYWMVASDGGIFAFGDAPFKGSTGSMKLNQPVVGMTRTPTSNGYWFVASDGGIFAYGDAPFFGSMGGKPLNKPIVAMAATSTGKGYWMVASDGGIFAFGDAAFYGSTGGKQLSASIVGMAPTSTGNGYWLVGADGGIFSFGDAQFQGSTGGTRLNQPIVGMDGF